MLYPLVLLGHIGNISYSVFCVTLQLSDVLVFKVASNVRPQLGPDWRKQPIGCIVQQRPDVEDSS